VASAVFAMRLALPSHLGDRGLSIYAAWVLDAVQNGRWICQINELGVVASKPPLYIWLAGLATLAAGRISFVTLFVPGALATLGTALAIYLFGRTLVEPRAALLGGLMYLLSYIGAAQMALARPDPVFTLAVTAGAFLALRAWRSGGGWTWFWLAAAAATLAKGPLGVLLAAGGLLAAPWERWSDRPRPMPRPIRGSHAIGLGLFLAITGGWLVLAYLSLGQRVLDRMIIGELLGHAVGDRGGGVPGQRLHVQPLTVLWTFAPWSLLAALGLWRAVRRPSANPDARQVERFLACWFLTGLVILSLAPHQDPRHLFPIIPPAALLAGRELARLLPPLRPAALAGAGAATAALVFGILTLGYHLLLDDRERVVNTRAAQELAGSIRQRVGPDFPLVHVDTPFALQLFMNTITPAAAPREAAALLSGPDAAFVAVRDPGIVRAALRAGAPPLHEVARWPENGAPYLRVLSNHPRLEWVDDMAALFPPIRVELHGMRLLRRRGETFVLQASRAGARAVFVNEGREILTLRTRVQAGAGTSAGERMLAPGARWELAGGPDAAAGGPAGGGKP